jgi:hypothetical protein
MAAKTAKNSPVWIKKRIFYYLYKKEAESWL